MTEHFQQHHGENPSETLVRFTVEQTLGHRVCSFDDRRGTSCVDAIIHRQGGVPLEIVSDPWVEGNMQTNALAKKAHGLTIPGLKAAYKIQLASASRVNKLTWVGPILRLLDDPATQHHVPNRSAEYESILVWPFGAPGRVIFTTGGGGGREDYSGHDVVTAAAEILTRETYADVAMKLDAHGGDERHAAVIVDEDQTPAFAWLRTRREGDLPELADLPAPPLPEEITHLWITPRYPRALTLRWSPDGGWAGRTWSWGDPVEALNAWDDPACPVAH